MAVDEPGEGFAGIGPLDTAPIGPIDDTPEEPDSVEAALKELTFVRELGKDVDPDTYRRLVRELDREVLTFDERNDLGCAWAWLAHLDDDFELWSLAIAALERSRDDAARRKKDSPAGENLGHVHAALRAAGGTT